jgi:hypothetical protein
MGFYTNKLSNLLNKVILEHDKYILEANEDEDDVASGESDNFMDDTDDGDNADDNDNDSVDSGESDNFMDDDESDNDTSSTTDEDDVASGESDNFMDDTDDGDNDGGENADDNDNDSVDSGESDNFMDDDESDEDGESTDNTEETEGEENQSEEEEDKINIDDIESELFSNLTPEQIAIKNQELKNQFIEIYTIIGSTLSRVNDISKSNDNINILKFITESLLELREMVDYNITVGYNTRTYIENNIIYKQCIATLDAIAEIIDNIPNVNGINSNLENEKKEEEKEDLGEPVEPDEDKEQKQLDISDMSTASDYQEESYAYNDINILF